MPRAAASSLLGGVRSVRRLARRERLRRRVAHFLSAARDGVLAGLARQCADVSGELPNLIVGELAAPRRHAVRPALGDARGDLVDAAAVPPFVVHQRRTHAPAAVAVAPGTVHLREQRLALADRRCIVVVELGAGVERGGRLATGPYSVGALTRRKRLTDRLGAAVALFAVARA